MLRRASRKRLLSVVTGQAIPSAAGHNPSLKPVPKISA